GCAICLLRHAYRCVCNFAVLLPCVLLGLPWPGALPQSATSAGPWARRSWPRSCRRPSRVSVGGHVAAGGSGRAVGYCRYFLRRAHVVWPLLRRRDQRAARASSHGNAGRSLAWLGGLCAAWLRDSAVLAHDCRPGGRLVPVRA